MKINYYPMYIFLERAKDFFWLLVTALASILSPVKNVLIVLLIAFVFNIFTGIIAKVGVEHQRFSSKKAFNAIVQLTFFFACATFIHYSAFFLEDVVIGKTGIKWLTYIVVYFYLTNIFKNARIVFPKNRAINFIYELLSTSIFDRLKNVVGYKSKNDENKQQRD